MYQYKGKKINGHWVDDKGTKYPPGWVEGATAAQLKKIGVKKVADPSIPAIDPAKEKILELESGELSVVNLSGSEVSAYLVVKQQLFELEIQQRLDDFARTRNYDSILSVCTYSNSTNAGFKADADYCVSARDETWAAAYKLLAEVKDGTRTLPKTIADIEKDLPVLKWPVN